MSSEASHGAGEYEIRPVAESEWPVFHSVMDTAFHEHPAEDERKLWRDAVDDDRTMAVWDESELVATGGAFRFRMTVPGPATVPAAGVTMITVKATHRRRGLLSSMMRHQLHGLHDAGDEPVAILTASEPAIYGRFGYGQGSFAYALSIPRRDPGPGTVPGSDKFRLRMVDPREAYDRCQVVFEAEVASRPGMLLRDDRFKEFALSDVEGMRHGGGPLMCVIAEAADGTVAAFARYRVKEDYDSSPGRSTCKVIVEEAYGLDVASYAAVWRYLLDIDLTDEVKVRNIAVDDPLLTLLADPRAAQPLLKDHIYTRLVDVDRALTARRYATPVDAVFEVADTFCPWNAGRWRLTGDASGAVCERTTDPADLLLGIRELGSAYLGGVTLGALGRAGRVQELRPGALAAASLAFRSDPAPFLPFGF